MSRALISLMPVRAGDLEVGKPLRQPVYDWHGKLLLAAGAVVESRNQLDALLANGFMHDPEWDPAPRQRAGSASRIVAQQETSAPPMELPESDAKEALVALDEVRWQVGETMYLQQIDNAAIRYTVRLIGFVKNQTVLVTPPMADGKLEFIRDGQLFVVRAFSGRRAYAFSAAAVKSVLSPYPYLHLSYPKQVRCTVVRRGARAEVKIIASVTLGEPPRTGAATLTDLSIGGAAGLMKQPLGEKGDAGRIKFKVNAAGQDEFLDLRVVLRSVGPGEPGSGFRHGFEFVDVSVRDRLILSAFVHQTLADTD